MENDTLQLHRSIASGSFEKAETGVGKDDVVYGYEGLHTIRPSLEMRPSDAAQVLGKDVVDWINNKYKWYNDYFGIAKN